MMPQGVKAPTPARNRLDHILPRSYLEGFTNQQGQVSVFDCRRKRWFEAIPARVAAEKGYYDYSPESVPDQMADEVFSELESRFPVVRKELIASGFSAWTTHLEFLLRYAQMLRARSRLFRAHALSNGRKSILGVVEEVVNEANPTESGTIRAGLTLKPYVPEDETQQQQRLRNMTITQMRLEIAKGSGLFSRLHWCLRATDGFRHPAVTADAPVIALGSAPALDEDVMLHDSDTWVVFPVCREACLIGNPSKIDVETEPFQPSGLTWLQGWYFKADSGCVYSPSRIPGQAES